MAELDDLNAAEVGVGSQLAANQAVLQGLSSSLSSLVASGGDAATLKAGIEAVATKLVADTQGLAADDAAANPPAPTLTPPTP